MQYKVINLKLIMKVQMEKTPLTAHFMGTKHVLAPGENTFIFPLSKIDQVLKIDFNGFTPNEKSQYIELELYHNKKMLDTKKISSFLMENNQYVENKLMKIYDKIHFNGTLSFRFLDSWVEMEIISGFTVSKNRKDFISISQGDHQQAEFFKKRLDKNKNKEHFLALVGTCHQQDVKKKYTPSLFSKLQEEYPHKSILNYSSEGLNDWCILHNSIWVLDNLKVKNLLFTLNVGTYMPVKIKIFDHVSYWPLLNAPSPSDFDYRQQLKLYRFNKNNLAMWKNILNKKLLQLLKRCKYNKVNPIILNYGSREIWHNNHFIDWYSEYKNNKHVSLDKRTQFTNHKIFDQIQSMIV